MRSRSSADLLRRRRGVGSAARRPRPTPRGRPPRARRRAQRPRRRALLQRGPQGPARRRPAAGSATSCAGSSPPAGASCGSMRLWASRTYGQRGWKRAARRLVDQRRRAAGDRDELLVARRVQARDRPQQAPRVGVLGRGEDRLLVGVLDDPPGVHHGDVVGDLGDDAEVVGDHHDRGVELASAGAGSASRICAWTVTSSAVVGSSAISSLGSLMSAIAIITRWRMPPENSCG